MTDKLPDNGGYVAAAYLVFLLLLLIYLAVLATRAGRLERDLGDVLDILSRDGDRSDEESAGETSPAAERTPARSEA